jgi:hypothetical protein
MNSYKTSDYTGSELTGENKVHRTVITPPRFSSTFPPAFSIHLALLRRMIVDRNYIFTLYQMGAGMFFVQVVGMPRGE